MDQHGLPGHGGCATRKLYRVSAKNCVSWKVLVSNRWLGVHGGCGCRVCLDEPTGVSSTQLLAPPHRCSTLLHGI